MSDPIKRVELSDGTVRYRFVIDIGRDRDGKRRQKTHTFTKKRDAQAEYARIKHETAKGVYVAPAGTDVNTLLDDYLTQASRDVEVGTASNYRHALLPVRERLGDRRVQSLREEDIDNLVDWMLTAGRRRGGKPGTGVGARTVSLTLGQLRAALNLGVRRQLLVRNVAADTKIPREARKAAAQKRAERQPWTADETRAFLDGISGDRIHAAVLLSAIGLRPAEVCGAPWSDLDLKAQPATIAVVTTRTIVDGEAIEKGPKSVAGKRRLPLPDVVAAALRELRVSQIAEQLAAGEAYSGTGHILSDELGRPYRTDQFRRRLYRLMAQAGVRKVAPYDMRHSCLTYLLANGVPDVVVSAWAGHADLSLAKRVYAHPDETHLAAGATALNALLGPRL